MGSGTLKTLSSCEVSHNQFLYVLPCGCHSSKPHVCLLLRSLSGRSCNDGLFFIIGASVVDYRVASLTRLWRPILLTTSPVPGMLRAVATYMSLFVTRIALNFV